ncbi:hypothetical protein C1645_824296 [Glomus cerebriforme]|uniref:Uncharacterized protein n=1 Tax=Glomus cerebriforme TaxID=658196 RepID=A0A397T3Q9_9GLOM|nr:hypothetical protein C1645_824296 [Glomus cerebriforme]
MVQNIHLLPFDEVVFNNANVIALGDLRDDDGAKFENILMEIESTPNAMRLHGISFYVITPISVVSMRPPILSGSGE